MPQNFFQNLSIMKEADFIASGQKGTPKTQGLPLRRLSFLLVLGGYLSLLHFFKV